jgi:ribosomal-protein-alanine N-acetyltransferase
MVLREVRWQDIPELAALEAALFAGEAWSEATWWRELAGRPRRHYVVETSGSGADAREAVVGYGGLDLSGDVADVMTLAVSPGARRRGVGARLLKELIQVARSRGARRLMLEVRADNGAARALYEARGFTVLRVRPRYYQPGDVDALVMRLDLVGAD